MYCSRSSCGGRHRHRIRGLLLLGLWGTASMFPSTKFRPAARSEAIALAFGAPVRRLGSGGARRSRYVHRVAGGWGRHLNRGGENRYGSGLDVVAFAASHVYQVMASMRCLDGGSHLGCETYNKGPRQYGSRIVCRQGSSVKGTRMLAPCRGE